MNRRRNTILIAAAVAAVVIILRFLPQALHSEEYPALTFFGGAREVGGSCYMLEVDDSTSILVDCGAFSDAGSDILPPHPDRISFMILTHAHSDHCGLIPELFREGFQGAVYCATPTGKIVPRMLKMARSFKRDRVPREIYNLALGSIQGVEFGKWIREKNISFRFRRAEHLLGAGFVEININNKSEKIRMVFSGDLGSGNSILLQPLESCEEADFVVMESTYGGRIRNKSAEEGREEFALAVSDALKRGGDVLIPAFTLGRTQEVIAVLELYRKRGVIPENTLIYSDSPTANGISDIFRNNRSCLNSMAVNERFLETSALREVKSKSSLEVHGRRHRPSVFISSSGNLDYANSPRHLMRMFDDERNLLCLVGWQSPRSLGRRLQNGEDPVLVRYSEKGKYNKKWIRPELEVRTFHCFSGHADQSGLLAWLENINGIKKLFLVHGDYDQALALKGKIKNINVIIPERGERVELSN